jgi:hypothetical protein
MTARRLEIVNATQAVADWVLGVLFSVHALKVGRHERNTGDFSGDFVAFAPIARATGSLRALWLSK